MAPSQLGGFTRSSPEHATANVEIHTQPLSLDKFGDPLHPFNAFTSSICNLRPTSRGHVRIKSPDPRAAPAINPRYLSTDEDRKVAIDSLRLTRRVAQQPALARFEPEEFVPGPQFESDEELVQAAGNVGTTIFHPVSTCRMGRDDDPTAVVDCAAAGARPGRTAHRRRVDHADHHVGQHQLADADDRGEGGGDDPGGSASRGRSVGVRQAPARPALQRVLPWSAVPRSASSRRTWPTRTTATGTRHPGGLACSGPRSACGWRQSGTVARSMR